MRRFAREAIFSKPCTSRHGWRSDRLNQPEVFFTSRSYGDSATWLMGYDAQFIEAVARLINRRFGEDPDFLCAVEKGSTNAAPMTHYG